MCIRRAAHTPSQPNYGAVALVEKKPQENQSCCEKIAACWRRFFCCCLPKNNALSPTGTSAYNPVSPAGSSEGKL